MSSRAAVTAQHTKDVKHAQPSLCDLIGNWITGCDKSRPMLVVPSLHAVSPRVVKRDNRRKYILVDFRQGEVMNVGDVSTGGIDKVDGKVTAAPHARFVWPPRNCG